MKYLLDVNSLVALGFLQHEFHGRVADWVRILASKGVVALATCPITQLGFVRVLAQVPHYGFTVAHASNRSRAATSESGPELLPVNPYS
jgi:predicted nucleic acid-binding protein